MGGIGVVLNPHSKRYRKNPEKLKRMGFIVGDKGDFASTKDLHDVRRVAEELLGITVEVIVGQPPIPGQVDGQTVEFRYFFCGMISGEAKSESFAELRWVSLSHLREYDFDAASKPVVDWILA